MYLIISKIRTAPYQLCPLENRCVLLLRKHKRNDCTAKVQNKLELEKETRRNLKYFSKKFGAYRNNSYLCSVKSLLLAIRVSFPRGQAVYVTTHLKATLGWFFIF